MTTTRCTFGAHFSWDVDENRGLIVSKEDFLAHSIKISQNWVNLCHKMTIC